MLVTAGCLLAGCSTISSMNPIDWWHRQQGGKIAEDRPVPPGADQPYPNLSTVPARPDAPDQAELKKLTDSLVADRTNAQHVAQSDPLADPSSPAASPNLFGVGTAPPPLPASGSPAATRRPGTPAEATETPVASASLPAVTAPASPPSPAPRKAVQSAPLEPLSTQAEPGQARPAQSAPNQAAPARLPSSPAASPGVNPSAAGSPAGSGPDAATVGGSGATIAGPPPTLPAGPPPRPAVAGVPPAAPVMSPPPMPAASAGPSATIVFTERTTNLTQPANEEVKAFATKRGNGTISVIGYGDSNSSDPDAQSAALTLGLSRAQSIVEALKTAGVPGNAIRVSAEASGRGASLQLLQ